MTKYREQIADLRGQLAEAQREVKELREELKYHAAEHINIQQLCDVANARAEAAERERDAKEEELDVWRNEATPSQQRASKRIAVLEGALRNERSISHGRTTEPHIEGPSEECSNEKCVRLTAALAAPGTSGADDAALVPNPNCPECRGSGKYKTINSGDEVNGREQS